MSESNVLPFGKYQGRLVKEVLADDPAYLQWLSGQDWFRAKFTLLHQVQEQFIKTMATANIRVIFGRDVDAAGGRS